MNLFMTGELAAAYKCGSQRTQTSQNLDGSDMRQRASPKPLKKSNCLRLFFCYSMCPFYGADGALAVCS